MIERPPSSQEKTIDSAIVRIVPKPKTYMYATIALLAVLVVFWAIPWGRFLSSESALMSGLYVFRSWILPFLIVCSVVMDHVKRGKDAFHFLIRILGTAALLFIALAIWSLFGLKSLTG